MRAVKSLAIIVGLLLLGSETYSFPARDNSISMEIEFPSPTITKIRGYHRVTMAGMPSLGKPGEPVLPVKTVRFLIPFGHEVGAIDIVKGQKIDLSGAYNVEPGQKPATLSDRRRTAFTSPKRGIYRSRNPFPGRAHTTRSVQSKRGYRILPVNLHPMEYIPGEGKLYYYKTMTIEVETVPRRVISVSPLYRSRAKDEKMAALH